MRWLLIIGLLIINLMASAETIYFIKIADTNTLIPNGQGKFISLDTPFIYNGNIVFRGYGKNQQAGIYTNLNGPLEVVADLNTLIPHGQGHFTSFSAIAVSKQQQSSQGHLLTGRAPTLDDHQIAFTGTGSNGQAGIYLYTNGKIKYIADKNTPIPNGNGNFQQFGTAYLSAGNVAFSATGSDDQQGIYVYLSDQKKLKVLYDTSTPIPDGDGNFTTFWNPDFDNGVTAFLGMGDNDQQGVYDDAGGTLRTVADKNTFLPSGDGTFTSLGAPSVQAGKVAFRAGDESGQVGIYSDETGFIEPVATQDTHIPNGVGTFKGVFSPSIDGKFVIFTGNGYENLQGIYLNHDGYTRKIIDITDELSGKKIKSLDLGAVSMSHSLIAFHVTFIDNSQAIYLAKLDETCKVCQ